MPISLLGCWLLLCMLSTVASAQEFVNTVTVQDLSQSGSPFRISGSVEIRESLSGSTISTEVREGAIVARNISDKTILMFVAWLDITPTRTVRERSVRQYECFFAADVIPPGNDHSLANSHVRTEVQPTNPSSPPHEPKAEIRIVFVQFLDGSTYGHLAFAEKMLQLRRVTLQHLRRLDRAYARGGDAAFLEELNERVEPAAVDNFLENIRQTQRSRGTPMAVSQVWKALRFADERARGFRAPPRG